ncbi:MAG: hypothetical protein HYV63_32170 [Candidatus Schekmanbacteria bacterium]|nr:hypothetical protein [Candidatus Schekmanbacteria bacterium]
MLAAATMREREAIYRAHTIGQAVERAHQGALNVIDPVSGHPNSVDGARAVLVEVAAELHEVGTTMAREAARNFLSVGDALVQERQAYVEVMRRVAERERVRWEAVETAARLWELDRQERAATWPGTRERLHCDRATLWGKLTDRA